MFRRLWSGLPKDADFPGDLEGLGYFINDQDEVRSIENPDNYFKFFINRNSRVNQRQRFALDAALRDIIHHRLQDEGLEKIRLPLGAGPHERHVPVFATPDLARKSRVVVIFGEPTQHLGLLAGRVANGPGGINKGSMVSVVRALRRQVSTGEDASPPGIVLANPGEVYWWAGGGRPLTVADSASVPLPSLVHGARRYSVEENGVPGSEDAAAHVSHVFGEFLGREGLLGCGARVSVVAVGHSCELVTRFLDGEEDGRRWLGRVDGMLLMGSVYPREGLRSGELRGFLAKRSRAYILSPEPVDTPLAPPAGNPGERIPALGSPCFSSGEEKFTEKILIAALEPALRYLEDVATTPGYENEGIPVAEKRQPAEDCAQEEVDWEAVPEGEKPSVGVADGEAMRAQVRNVRRFRKIVARGEVPDTDSSDDDEEEGMPSGMM